MGNDTRRSDKRTLYIHNNVHSTWISLQILKLILQAGEVAIELAKQRSDAVKQLKTAEVYVTVELRYKTECVSAYGRAGCPASAFYGVFFPQRCRELLPAGNTSIIRLIYQKTKDYLAKGVRGLKVREPRCHGPCCALWKQQCHHHAPCVLIIYCNAHRKRVCKCRRALYSGSTVSADRRARPVEDSVAFRSDKARGAMPTHRRRDIGSHFPS